MCNYKNLFTAVLVLSLTLMSGCGSSDDESVSETATNTVASSQIAAPAFSAANSLGVDGNNSGVNDDLSKSKGIDQDVIVKLVPSPGQENVDTSTKIEAVFSIPLDPSSVQKNNVKLVYLSSKTNDHVKGVISYNEETKTVTYTPDDPLKPGVYEVEIKSLKPTKENKAIYIKEIKYRFLVGGELEESDPTPTVTLLSSESNQTIVYNHITLEVNTTNTASLSAVNQTLVAEQNRTIKIKGVDNNGTYYLYNLPLLQGSNEINITATSEDNVSLSTLISLTSEANGTAPIGMRAGSYEGIGSLQTTVEVGTLLNVGEYLFDSNGDGVIDEIHTAADSNFTVNYTEEGRYKPRVTIRTTDNQLYSSRDFALSLDVKMTEEQKDPTGAEPVDVAKAFVKALIDDDRATVEKLLGNDPKLIDFIYSDPRVTENAKWYYSHIISWEQSYFQSSAATVKIHIKTETEEIEGAFNLMRIDGKKMWLIDALY
ncbi:Ig-like domain-containing protein [Sulfurovum sp.]|uniref:Ig-like domain-containing protein n=1 Tax=Sulfurovum sp. TaxID=1969726 RepID=UPI003562D728